MLIQSALLNNSQPDTFIVWIIVRIAADQNSSGTELPDISAFTVHFSISDPPEIFALHGKMHHIYMLSGLRPDICRDVAHRLDGDFWVIPMSFWECFCEPGSEDGNVLLEGFRKTQETHVPPAERVTDQILFYDSRAQAMRLFR